MYGDGNWERFCGLLRDPHAHSSTSILNRFDARHVTMFFDPTHQVRSSGRVHFSRSAFSRQMRNWSSIERALKADPNHVLTWQYYGLWQIEQGNRDSALYHLSRIAAICGTDCEHYRSLAAALEQPPGTGLVY